MMGALGGELRVPISAIESYAYCPRQCALVHVERSYKDNVFTLRGRHVHERVHAGQDTADHGIETLRALLLYSDRLGLIGQADLVEMRPAGPYPVEFKPGHTHRTPAELQLCAQALCLEEMYGLPVPAGAIYEAGVHMHGERSYWAMSCAGSADERSCRCAGCWPERSYRPLPTSLNAAEAVRCSIYVCQKWFATEP